MALFPPGKGGGEEVEYGFKGKGITIHSLVDGNGRPLAVTTTSAKGDERHQVIPLLEVVKLKTGKKGRSRCRPKKLQADKGYDSNELRSQLRKKGICSLIPRRKWKGCKKRCGRRPSNGVDRWKVERTFAWYQRKFRRLVARWERRSLYWNGFLLLAVCLMWLEVLVR
ncbi:MAG: transposase [Proteobacteria bacterium]|nr:transposase [Pseudomonadota bacterium]MBU2462018.1 transposase [bacterium]